MLLMTADWVTRCTETAGAAVVGAAVGAEVEDPDPDPDPVPDPTPTPVRRWA